MQLLIAPYGTALVLTVSTWKRDRQGLHFLISGPRTNNNLEAWHGHFKKEIGSAHPNIYTFISAIKAEHDNYETKLIQVADNADPNPRPPKLRERDDKIRGLIQRYTDGELTIADFLDRVGSFNKMKSRPN